MLGTSSNLHYYVIIIICYSELLYRTSIIAMDYIGAYQSSLVGWQVCLLTLAMVTYVLHHIATNTGVNWIRTHKIAIYSAML